MMKWLFIGSFLSKRGGSLSASEYIAKKLNSNDLSIKLVSKKENKVLRILEIIFNILVANSRAVSIDVYSGQAFRIAEIASWLTIFRRKKILLILHGGALPDFFLKKPKRVANVYKRANCILTPSLFLKNFFEKEGFHIEYLPNSIDTNHFFFNRSVVNPLSLLWVRAFTNIYNPKLAIETLAVVRKTHPGATLTMVGPDKGLLNSIKRFVRELNLDQAVYFTGPIPNEKLNQYYQSHQVYLNTTSYESFGVALVEAAACGIPMVSTNVGEIPYLWTHDKDILTINDFKAESLGQQVVRILDDEELAKKLSINARQLAQVFDWEKTKPFWLELLSGINNR